MPKTVLEHIAESPWKIGYGEGNRIIIGTNTSISLFVCAIEGRTVKIAQECAEMLITYHNASLQKEENPTQNANTQESSEANTQEKNTGNLISSDNQRK